MPANDTLLRNLRRREGVLESADEATFAAVLEILEAAEADILGSIMREDLANYSRQRLEGLLEQVRRSLEVAYGAAPPIIHQGMAQVAGGEIVFLSNTLAAIVQDVPQGFGVVRSVGLGEEQLLALARETLVDMGEAAAPVTDWIAQQSSRAQADLLGAIRNGYARGEGSAVVARRVRDKLGAERAWSEIVVRTANTAIAKEAREIFARDNMEGPGAVVSGIVQITFFDARTTAVCLAYAGKRWRLQDGEWAPVGHALPHNGGVPRHPGCRSSEMPVVMSWEEMGIPADLATPEIREFFDGQIPAGQAGSDLFAAASPATRRAALGVGVSGLLESGAITVDDLVDRFGRPRSLKDIRASL